MFKRSITFSFCVLIFFIFLCIGSLDCIKNTFLYEIKMSKNEVARRTRMEDSIVEVDKPFGRVQHMVSNSLAAGKILESIEDEFIKDERLLEAKQTLLNIIGYLASGNFELDKLTHKMVEFSKAFNYLEVEEGQEDAFNTIIIAKSILARDVASEYLEQGAEDELGMLRDEAVVVMNEFIEGKIEAGEITEAGRTQCETAEKFIDEWLNEPNIPKFIKQGLVRAMLEGRSDDLVFAFGAGWREFGTAGIRNQGVNSNFPAIQLLELEEFAQNPQAPVLAGPNTINSITLLQQTATVSDILLAFIGYLEENPEAKSVELKDLMMHSRLYQRALASGKEPSLSKLTIDLPEKFRQDLLNNKVTIAYDSRLNGEWLAHMLAADLLDSGIKVDLFDNVGGMPALVYATSRLDSVFGFLISASHSEPNFNGFKFAVGYLMSQVDKSFQQMIMVFRNLVEYDDITLDLATKRDFGDLLAENASDLRWLGTGKPREGFDYYEAENIDVYSSYYDHVEPRSPLALLPEAVREQVEEVKERINILYSAFSGAGAVDAGDFPGFLKRMGYELVEIIESQTAHVDGRFPAFIDGWELGMPDPGNPKAVVVNLMDYLVQEAGEELSNLGDAIEKLNQKYLGLFADPDIDRASMVIPLPVGVPGNIKETLIKFVEGYIDDNFSGDERKAMKEEAIDLLQTQLNDKLLLTANDAWMLLVHNTLKMLESEGELKKDQLYVIVKSHVTTSGLKDIAQYYSEKGYNVCCVDTFVGFTLLAKRANELFDFAKQAWETVAHGERIEGVVEQLKSKLAILEEAYGKVAGQIEVVDKTMELVREIVSRENLKATEVEKVLEKLALISNIVILAGVEESNGYGEFGRVLAAEGEPAQVVNEHIREKDGSLAAYKFAELLAYLKYRDISPYEAYIEMFKDIGVIPATFNSWTRYPGAAGALQKVETIQVIEKFLAFAVLQRVDKGGDVEFFGKYRIDTDDPVTIFWSDKYDNNFRRFPNAGIRIRFIREYQRKTYRISVTYRPSGTGMENRDYNWTIAVIPAEAQSADGLEQIEEIRQEVEEVLVEQINDFFGDLEQETGYLDAEVPYGLLLAMKEGGPSKFIEIFARALGEEDLELSEFEEQLYQNAVEFAFAARRLKGKISPEERKTYQEKLEEARQANRQIWSEYLTSPEAVNYPNKVEVSVNGETVEVPRAMAITWTVSLADYIAGLIEEEDLVEVTISSNIPHLVTLVTQQLEPEGITVIEISK